MTSSIPFFDRIRRIDEILAVGPEKHSFEDTVQPLLLEDASIRYFYGEAKDPAWIEPLRRAKQFDAPPSDRWWPQADFLKRMAARDSKQVLEIALRVCSKTKNPSIHYELAEAALAMPPAEAAEWVRADMTWIGQASLVNTLFPDTLGKLVSHLARGGKMKVAFELARTILDVLPDPHASELTADETGWRPSPNPTARFDAWNYGEIINKNVSDLLTVDPERTFHLFLDLLLKATALSRKREDDQGPDDYSFIWRPAIEDHEQNTAIADIKNVLVSALRDTVEKIGQRTPEKVPELVRNLESRKWHVFQRLALHLLCRSPEAAPSLIAERLTNRALFDEPCLRHEYMLLAKDHFGRLEARDQKTILAWVDSSPDQTEVREHLTSMYGRPATEEEVDRYCRRWRRDRVAPFHESLPDVWKRRYEEWCKKLGEPDHPDFAAWMTSCEAEGPISPKSDKELAGMSVEQLAAFLKKWKPTGEFMKPSYYGLGARVRALVAASPERFASEAEKFQPVDCTYVRLVLHGFRDALNQKRPFPWEPILHLCRWIAKQPTQMPGRQRESKEDDRDDGWRPAKGAVDELISDGLDSETSPIPIEQRSLVWEIIDLLIHTDDRTDERIAMEQESSRNPVLASLSTVRGQAMHCVFRYASWVIDQRPKEQKPQDHGLETIPEVKRVLEEHLDPEKESSEIIRAVYGEYLIRLVAWDGSWVRERLTQFFPTESSQQHLGDVVWEAYVTTRRPWGKIHEILAEQYRRAVQRIGTRVHKEARVNDPDECLASHLMILYWRGKLSLNEPGELLDAFYAKAPAKLRAHAIEFVGRSLYNTKDEVDQDIGDRMRKLWEHRLSVVRDGSQTPKALSELLGFGWWFVAGQLDPAWEIQQLLEVLKLAKDVDPDSLVVKALGERCDSMPAPCVKCLSAWARAPRRPVWFHLDEPVRRILVAALQSPDATAHQMAIELINDLGSQGVFKYRDLLPKS